MPGCIGKGKDGGCDVGCSARAPGRAHACLFCANCNAQPSNVLLNSECLVKMADFGLARSMIQLSAEEGNPVLTDYVATRWYRAPEILLSSMRYTYGVDMWACGASKLGAVCRGRGVVLLWYQISVEYSVTWPHQPHPS